MPRDFYKKGDRKGSHSRAFQSKNNKQESRIETVVLLPRRNHLERVVSSQTNHREGVLKGYHEANHTGAGNRGHVSNAHRTLQNVARSQA